MNGISLKVIQKSDSISINFKYKADKEQEKNMKRLLIGLLIIGSISGHANDVVHSATDNTAAIYLCNNVNKNAKITCKEEAPKYQKLLNETLRQEGIAGSISVAGIYQSSPAGFNCYLVIKLDSTTHSLIKMSDKTSSTFNKNTRAQNLKNLTEEITQRSGYLFNTIRNNDGSCGDRNLSSYGNLVDSVYLIPNRE
jgi:hypothetical protein